MNLKPSSTRMSTASNPANAASIESSRAHPEDSWAVSPSSCECLSHRLEGVQNQATRPKADAALKLVPASSCGPALPNFRDTRCVILTDPRSPVGCAHDRDPDRSER